MGCKGPTTYNACSTVRWNNGVPIPIESGHRASAARKTLLGSGPFYDRLTTINQFGIEKNADKVGRTAAASSASLLLPMPPSPRDAS